MSDGLHLVFSALRTLFNVPKYIKVIKIVEDVPDWKSSFFFFFKMVVRDTKNFWGEADVDLAIVSVSLKNGHKNYSAFMI